MVKKLSTAYLKKEAKEKNTYANKKHEKKESKGREVLEHKGLKKMGKRKK